MSQMCPTCLWQKRLTSSVKLTVARDCLGMMRLDMVAVGYRNVGMSTVRAGNQGGEQVGQRTLVVQKEYV
jgi:hypothetical protein